MFTIWIQIVRGEQPSALTLGPACAKNSVFFNFYRLNSKAPSISKIVTSLVASVISAVDGDGKPCHRDGKVLKSDTEIAYLEVFGHTIENIGG